MDPNLERFSKEESYAYNQHKQKQTAHGLWISSKYRFLMSLIWNIYIYKEMYVNVSNNMSWIYGNNLE